MDLVPALAVMLGANVGTTQVVQVLSFNISVVTPVLLLAGVIAFKRGGRTRTRDLGRVVIGIGLMLLALHIFLGALVTAEGLPVRRAKDHSMTLLFLTENADYTSCIRLMAIDCARGLYSEGLKTTVFPQSNARAQARSVSCIGAFQGATQ